MRRQEDDRSAEAIAEELRQRYKRSTRYGAQSDYAQVPQRMLMPSVEDPNLWSVPVKVSDWFSGIQFSGLSETHAR